MRNILRDNNLKYYLVYPNISLKEEYLNRFKMRNCTENYLTFIDNI